MWPDEVSHLTWTKKFDGEGKIKGEGKEEESREKDSTFSLDFPTIGPSVYGEVRGKVLPRDKSYK